MKRFFRKAAMWLAGIAAALTVLLVVFYAEENWRGARDWAACQRELAAKGESLDLRQLAPPGKPEDDLSKRPIFAEFYQKVPPVEPRIRRVNIYLESSESVERPKPSLYLAGKPIILAEWQKFYRSLGESNYSQATATPAQDVLAVLQRFDPEMGEVDSAVSNPNAYWPVSYDNPYGDPLGGITAMINVSMVLQLRGIAHLENNQADLAEKDYLSSLRLNQPVAQTSLVVSYLVMAGVNAIDAALLWEGLHRHAWSNAQLREMELALSSTDMLAGAAKALRTERAQGIQEMKYVQKGRYDLEVEMRMKIGRTRRRGAAYSFTWSLGLRDGASGNLFFSAMKCKTRSMPLISSTAS